MDASQANQIAGRDAEQAQGAQVNAVPAVPNGAVGNGADGAQQAPVNAAAAGPKGPDRGRAGGAAPGQQGKQAKSGGPSVGPRESHPKKGKSEAGAKRVGSGAAGGGAVDRPCKFGDACKDLAAGNCRFRHGGEPAGPKPENPAPGVVAGSPGQPAAPKPAVQKKITVTLDVQLSDREFEDLSKAFEHANIVNGSSREGHPHAFSRATRTCVEAVSLSLAGRPEEVLLMQGKSRASLSGKYEICRRAYFPEDADPEAQLCQCVGPDGVCDHERALLGGRYKTIALLDVPAPPDDLRRLLDAYPAVTQIITALHCYTKMVGRAGDQTYVWAPCSEPAPGSTGTFSVSCSGASTIVEPDHLWLTAGINLSGLKAETVREYPTVSYKVVRLTRSPVPPVDRVIRSSAFAFSQDCAPGMFSVAGAEFDKFGPTFGVFTLDGSKLPVNPVELASELRHVKGVEMTKSVYDRMARRIARSEYVTDTDHLMAVVSHIKMAEERAVLRSAFEPLRPSEGAWFAWMRPARRTVEAQNNAMRQGDDGGARHVGWKWLVMAVLLFVCSALPMPVWDWIEQISVLPTPWFSMEKFVLNVTSAVSIVAFLPTGINVVSVSQKATQIVWELSYTLWHLPVRALLFALAVLCMVGSAKATPTCPVRGLYIADRFAPVAWEGVLPLTAGSSFGLPGYVSQVEYKDLGEDCSVKLKGSARDVDIDQDKLYAIGLVFGHAIPHVAASCQENMLVAAHNRQCAAVPIGHDELFEALSAPFVEQFTSEVYTVQVASFEEWNARFPGKQQLDHIKARCELETESVSMAEIQTRDAFNKVEKIFKRKEYDPRCICGASDWWNVITGPWTLGIAGCLKRHFNYTNSTFYASSTTSGELGQWFTQAATHGGRAISGDDQIVVVVDQELGVVYLEGDGSRHDSHMNSKFHALKWTLYSHVCGGKANMPRSILDVYREGQRHTVAKSRTGVEFSHPYRVRSGDNDTFIGNTLCTDMVAHTVERRFKELRKTGAGIEEIQGVITRELKEGLGYVLELNITSDVSQVTFLSGYFVPVDGTTYWAPKIGKLMASLGWTTSLVGRVSRWENLAGTLNSFAAYKFMPFFNVFLAKVMSLVPPRYRLTPPSGQRTVASTGIWVERPGEDTWQFVESRYGLSKEDGKLFQVELERVTALPFMLNSDIIKRFVEVDCDL